MRFFPRHFVPALLLCSPLSAFAQIHTDGDYWLIHSQGNARNNQVFFADGDPAHMPKGAGGIVSLGVHQVHQNVSNRSDLTTYTVEVDCAKSRVRIKRASDIWTMIASVQPLKVSSAWQTKPEDWLAQSRDFVCRPDARTKSLMVPMGRMPMLRMVEAARVVFTQRERDQARTAILKEIDDALDRMPVN